MTEQCIIPNRFAPPHGASITKDSLLRDRMPCAVSQITLTGENTDAGRIEFYSTPIGTVVSAVLFALPFEGEGYEPCFIEIDGRRQSGRACGTYRAKTSNLPPVFLKSGFGSISFTTDRFSAADIIGRSISLRKHGVRIASGRISASDNN